MKQWKKVAGTIITCCILHNTCLEVKDATEIGVVSDEDGFPRVLLPEHDSNADGVGLRNTIEDTLYYCFHMYYICTILDSFMFIIHVHFSHVCIVVYVLNKKVSHSLSC